MSQAFGENALQTSQILVVIMKKLLERIVQASETAVTEVTEKLQGMSMLTETQKEQLSSAMVSFYASEEGDDMKKLLNDNASAMFEAATNGDFASVDRLSSSPEYEKARIGSKKMHDTLQSFTTSDAALNEYIMPVLVSLQYQDNMRQEIEGIIKSMEAYFSMFVPSTPLMGGASVELVDFWKKISKYFNNIEARNIVLNVALGPDGVNEHDIRRSTANSLRSA
jgi:hypothetical protein